MTTFLSHFPDRRADHHVLTALKAVPASGYQLGHTTFNGI
jgi:hypothetical protein